MPPKNGCPLRIWFAPPYNAWVSLRVANKHANTMYDPPNIWTLHIPPPSGANSSNPLATLQTLRHSPPFLVQGVENARLDALGCSLHFVHVTLPHGSMELGKVLHLDNGITDNFFIFKWKYTNKMNTQVNNTHDTCTL